MNRAIINGAIAGLVAMAMLTAPVLAAGQRGCGGVRCTATVQESAPATIGITGCCHVPEQARTSQRVASHDPAPCMACCGGGDTAVRPNLPASRDQRLEVAVDSDFRPNALAVPAAESANLFSSLITAPFWFADDGPSRQAFLGRFTF